MKIGLSQDRHLEVCKLPSILDDFSDFSGGLGADVLILKFGVKLLSRFKYL